jgi:hypothetical protein
MEKREFFLWITVWLALSALGAIWLSMNERDKLQLLADTGWSA